MKSVAKYVIVVMLLASCAQDEPVSSLPERFVITGILRNNEVPTGFDAIELNGLGEINTQIPEAEISVTHGTSQIELEWTGSAFSYNGNDFIVESGLYRIDATLRGNSMSSEIEVPEPPLLTTLSNDTFTIDAGNPEAIAFQVNWSEIDDARYVLTIENLEEDPQPLPFAASGKFSSVYELPLVETFTSLRSDYFTYYGHHLLTIYSITGDYETSVFLHESNNLQNILLNGEDNVVGGSGYITGVAGLSVELWLEQ